VVYESRPASYSHSIDERKTPIVTKNIEKVVAK
jgi:hypothetical protein